MKKVIVTDLDGTLLNSSGFIHKSELYILHKLYNEGIIIIVATGRGNDAFQIINNLSYTGIILNNGMCSYDRNGVLINRLCINKIDLLITLEKLNELGFLVGCVKENIHYANFNVQDMWYYLSNWKYSEILSFPSEFDKLYIICSNDIDIKTIKEYLPPNYHLNVTKDNLAFILPLGVSKYTSLRFFLDKYNISIENVIAFGDDLNDFDLIKNCGIGVAMGNAVEPIKQIAKFVTRSNDEGGVSYMLSKIFKLDL